MPQSKPKQILCLRFPMGENEGGLKSWFIQLGENRKEKCFWSAFKLNAKALLCLYLRISWRLYFQWHFNKVSVHFVVLTSYSHALSELVFVGRSLLHFRAASWFYTNWQWAYLPCTFSACNPMMKGKHLLRSSLCLGRTGKSVRTENALSNMNFHLLAVLLATSE